MRTRNGFYYRPLLNIHETNKANLQANWSQAVVLCRKSSSQITILSESRSGRQRDRGLATYPDYYKQ